MSRIVRAKPVGWNIVVKLADSLRAWARGIKRDLTAIYLATKDPRMPWYAKALAVIVVAYALSPIDLIPDFIPVLGYLDDVILVPAGLLLVVWLMPDGLMAECKAKADAMGRAPANRAAAIVVVVLWVMAAIALTVWAYAYFAL